MSVHGFGPQMQPLLVRLMLEQPPLLAGLRPFLGPEHFEDAILWWVVSTAGDFFERHHMLPDHLVLREHAQALPIGPAELHCDRLDALFATPLPQPAQQAHIDEWACAFVRRRLLVAALEASRGELMAGRDESAVEALLDAARRIGQVRMVEPDRSAVFDDLEVWAAERQRRLAAGGSHVPTDIAPLDDAMGGGLEKGRLGLLLGEAKAGKSTTLRNFARAAIDRGLCVLYLVYEGAKEEVEAAVHSLYSHLPHRLGSAQTFSAETLRRLRARYDALRGSLHVRAFTRADQGAFNQTVEGAYDEIAQLERAGHRPDLVLVDYGDLLHSTRRCASIYEDQLDVHQALKTLSTKGYAVWSATQARRRAEGQSDQVPGVLGKDDVAECIGKSRVCDALVSLNRTRAEAQADQGRIHVAVLRSGRSGGTFPVRMDMRRGEVTTLPDDVAWVHADAGEERLSRRAGAQGRWA